MLSWNLDEYIKYGLAAHALMLQLYVYYLSFRLLSLFIQNSTSLYCVFCFSFLFYDRSDSFPLSIKLVYTVSDSIWNFSYQFHHRKFRFSNIHLRYFVISIINVILLVLILLWLNHCFIFELNVMTCQYNLHNKRVFGYRLISDCIVSFAMNKQSWQMYLLKIWYELK